MSSVSQGIDELIQAARAQRNGPRRASTRIVGLQGNSFSATIPKQFAKNIDLEKGDPIEPYVSEDGRAVVMLFPEGGQDE